MGHNDATVDDELVEQARAGDGDAFAGLYASWFDRVYDLAYRILRDENAAADVAQQAFLTAYRDLEKLRDDAAFGGWLLRITRNAAFDHRRREARTRPVEDVELAVSGTPGAGVEDRLIAADDPARAAVDGDLAALVWESAEALGERDAEVLNLSLRYELPPADIAEVLGTNRNHANQLVHRARNRLGDAVRARVLWHGGDPVCPDLAAALTDAGITRFGADAVRVTTAHADGCERCEERRKLKLAPVALFSAVPMLVAPVSLRQRVTEALAGEGVPVSDVSDAPEPGDVTPPGAGRPIGKIAAWTAVGAAAVAAATLGVIWIAGGDDGSESSVATEQGTTSPTVAVEPGPTTLPLAAPTDTTAPPVTTTPEVAPPPVTDPPPPPPPPAPPDGSLTMARSSQPPLYLMSSGPVLSWQTANAESVSVVGPGVNASGLTGSVAVCPTVVNAQNECVVSFGTYTYTLTATGADGQTITRQAVLTVAP